MQQTKHNQYEQSISFARSYHCFDFQSSFMHLHHRTKAAKSYPLNAAPERKIKRAICIVVCFTDCCSPFPLNLYLEIWVCWFSYSQLVGLQTKWNIEFPLFA